MHFFAKIFGHIKKKQYLCTTASHAVNPGSSPGSTTKELQMQLFFLFFLKNMQKYLHNPKIITNFAVEFVSP